MPREATVHDTSLMERAIGIRNQTIAAALARLESADRRLDNEQRARVRIDTSAADTADLLAQGRRMLLSGAAVALVILSIGLAIRIAFGSVDAAPIVPRNVEPPPVAALPPDREDIAALPPDRDDVVVSDYVLFTEAKRRVGGVDYVISAGHRFEDELAPTFSEAWCYTFHYIEGVRVSLQLGDLVPGKPAVPSPPDLTREAMGLTEAQAAELFRACPWLDSGALSPRMARRATVSRARSARRASGA